MPDDDSRTLLDGAKPIYDYLALPTWSAIQSNDKKARTRSLTRSALSINLSISRSWGCDREHHHHDDRTRFRSRTKSLRTASSGGKCQLPLAEIYDAYTNWL